MNNTMKPISIDIPRVTVASSGAVFGLTTILWVVAPVKSKDGLAWFDGIFLLEDLRDAQRAKIDLNKALFVAIQVGNELSKDDKGNYSREDSQEEDSKEVFRIRTGTLVGSKGPQRYWEELPSFNLDLEASGFNQNDLFEFMKEIAICHTQNKPLPAWNSFFSSDDGAEEETQAA